MLMDFFLVDFLLDRHSLDDLFFDGSLLFHLDLSLGRDLASSSFFVPFRLLPGGEVFCSFKCSHEARLASVEDARFGELTSVLFAPLSCMVLGKATSSRLFFAEGIARNLESFLKSISAVAVNLRTRHHELVAVAASS